MASVARDQSAIADATVPFHQRQNCAALEPKKCGCFAERNTHAADKSKLLFWLCWSGKRSSGEYRTGRAGWSGRRACDKPSVPPVERTLFDSPSFLALLCSPSREHRDKGVWAFLHLFLWVCPFSMPNLPSSKGCEWQQVRLQEFYSTEDVASIEARNLAPSFIAKSTKMMQYFDENHSPAVPYALN